MKNIYIIKQIIKASLKQELKRSMNHHKINHKHGQQQSPQKDTKFKYIILKFNFLNSHIDPQKKTFGLNVKQRTDLPGQNQNQAKFEEKKWKRTNF